MQITKISYGLTIKQADESYAKAHLEADVHPSDNFQTVKQDLITEVEKLVGLSGKSEKTQSTGSTATAEDAATPTQTSQGAKGATAPDRRALRGGQTAEKPAGASGAAGGEAKTAVKGKAGRPAGGGKATKETPYDRDDKDHKRLVRDVLNDLIPDWGKDPEVKALAGDVSKSLVGKPFLGADGAVLESFKEAIAVGMGLGDPGEEENGGTDDI